MVDWKSSYIPKRFGSIVMIGMVAGFAPSLMHQTSVQALPWFRERQTIPERASDQPPATSGQSAGSRGCFPNDMNYSQNLELQPLYPLSILNPDHSVQYTTLEYPTFAWVMGLTTPQSIEFRLYEYTNGQENIELLYETTLLGSQTSTGIKLFSLPSFLEPLSLDGKYIWQVEIVCDPARPSGNLFVEAELNRIEAKVSLQQSIQHASTISEKIKLLDSENLWIDALSLAVQNPDSGDQLQAQLEQFAIALNDTELHELVETFDAYIYTTIPN